MIKKQFTMYLKNRPGQLAAAIRRLAAAQINIEGISVAESTDVGLVQIVVSNPTETRKLLTEAAIPFTVQEVVVGELRNEPGALAQVVTELARHKININYVYATACHCGPDCRCYAVISAPDLKAVDRIWQSLT